MLKYRIYIIAVGYVILILAVLSLHSSRGCHTVGNDEKGMPLLTPGKFYSFSKTFTSADRISRGLIVLYNNPGEETVQSSRIIALPGDTVSIRGGTCFINGTEAPSAFISGKASQDIEDLSPTAVPWNMFFILPDNREGINVNDRNLFIHFRQIRGVYLRSYFKGDPL